MSTRRVVPVFVSILMMAGVLTAPPAQAATTTPDTVTVTYTSSVVVIPTSVAGSAGDTFTLINDRNNDDGISFISIVNAGGSVSVGGTSCTTETSCKVYDKTSSPRNSVQVTIDIPGTTTIRRSIPGTWSTVGTLTAGSGGAAVSVAPVPSFVLNFDGNGGTCVTTSSGPVATGGWVAVPLDGNCTRPGYTLIGFSTSPSNDPGGVFIPAGGSTAVTGDNTLYAQWKVRVSADWTANECPGADVHDINPGESVTLPAAKACGGRVLVGWALEPSAGAQVAYQPGQTVAPLSNLTVWAVWAPAHFISLTCPIVPESPVDVFPVAEGANLTLPTECGGRAVSTWTTNADGTGASYPAGASISAPADLMLYATAKSGTVTITWRGNKGSCPDLTTTVEWGSIFVPAACTRPDHSIIGWTTDGSPDGPSLVDTALRRDVDAYPIWTKTPNVRAAWVYGCPTVVKQAATWDEDKGQFQVTLPEASGCSNPPYELLGWNTAADGTGADARAGEVVAVEADTDYFAQWGVPITFDYNITDGSASCPPVVVVEPFGKKFDLPEGSSCERPKFLLGNWATMPTWQLGVDPHLVQPGKRATALVPLTYYAWWGAARRRRVRCRRRFLRAKHLDGGQPGSVHPTHGGRLLEVRAPAGRLGVDGQRREAPPCARSAVDRGVVHGFSPHLRGAMGVDQPLLCSGSPRRRLARL